MILLNRFLSILLLLGLSICLYGQTYNSPVAWPIKLSGTFGELRPGHFHMGIDIKSPDGGVGHTIRSIEDGYISRVQISSGGYGKVLHIIHPSGHESVYAHLNTFSPALDTYIKTQQYARESYELDLMLFPDQFVVQQGDKIGELGMTGRTFGPHLHFELRDKWTGEGLNPLNYGIPVADSFAPQFYQVVIYEMDNAMRILKSRNLDPSKLGKDIIVNSGHVGIGVKTYDRMEGVRNLNGVHAIQMNVDAESYYRFDFDTLRYDRQRYINAHKDFPLFTIDAAYVNRMFRLPGNVLNIYNAIDNGIIKLHDGQLRTVELKVSDSFQNERSIEFRLKQAGGNLPQSNHIFNHEIKQNVASTFKLGPLKVDFPVGCTYQDVYAKIHTQYNEAAQKDIHRIHNRREPVHRPYTLSLHLPEVVDSLRSKYFVRGISSKGDVSNLGGQWHGDTLVTRLYGFGDFSIDLDTNAPTIEPQSFQPNNTSAVSMSFTIKDDFRRSRLTYRATVDGQWILMEYDAKKDRLTHVFDGSIGPGSHQLMIEVKDRNGNISNQHYAFQR